MKLFFISNKPSKKNHKSRSTKVTVVSYNAPEPLFM